MLRKFLIIPDNKSNVSLNPTTKQHAVVIIQLNIVTCPTYPDKFIRDTLLHRFFRNATLKTFKTVQKLDENLKYGFSNTMIRCFV